MIRLPGQPSGRSSKRDLSMASAAYLLWPLALYVALAPSEGRFVRFHARQALVFDLAMAAIMAVSMLVPFIGAAIAVLVPVPWLAVAVMWAVKAYGGERAEMGVVYSIGRRWIER